MNPCHLILNHLHLIRSAARQPVLGDGRHRAPLAAWEWTGAVGRDCILTAWPLALALGSGHLRVRRPYPVQYSAE